MGSNKHSSNFNRMHIADYLMSEGIVTDRASAFKILEEGAGVYEPSPREDLLETVKVVVKCDGFPTIAHLVQYEKDLSDSDLQDMLDEIAGITKVFRVEIFHFKHKPEQIEKYLKMRDKTDADILFTAGSDCHGLKKGKPNRIGYPFDFELNDRYSSLYRQVSQNAVEFFTRRHFFKN